jgi:glutamate N-acetyltransferase/amino-acid N-acetyltransferase
MNPLQLASGYRFAGVHSGIRPDPNRLDLALIVSDSAASAAGVFTQNRVVAAPVQVSRGRLPSDRARGVVICSGNANACTGQRGLDDARRMTAVAAEMTGVSEQDMLVCSTGVIGRPLPMTEVEAGIRVASRQLEATGPALDQVAHAILTTDTRTKIASRIYVHEGRREVRPIRMTGLAKGAAMIGPNLATMLAFVFTDASVPPHDLQRILKSAADRSFNCVSVEGHTSTNDTLLLFANGPYPPLEGKELDEFARQVTDVCMELARAIAADAEGANHFIQVEVEGLRSDAEARQVAKAVADSPLVKTAVFGADPNWGRIVSAAGYSGVDFQEQNLSLWLGAFLLYQAGTPQPFDAASASAYLKGNREILFRLRFDLGPGHCTFWTCDLGYEYVRLNAEYTT